MFSDGDTVKQGEIIMEIETSKAIIEVDAPCKGHIFFNVSIGEEVEFSKICAVISTHKNLPENYFNDLSKQKSSSTNKTSRKEIDLDFRISKPAEALLKKNNLDPLIFKDKKIIRKQDIENYLVSTKKNKQRLKTLDIDSSKKQILIIGSGGHSKICIDIIQQSGSYEILGLIDPASEIGSVNLGIPVIGQDKDLQKLFDQGIKYAVVGIGSLEKPKLRGEIYQRLEDIGYEIPNIIHPQSIIEPSAKIGKGNQILAGALIGSDVRIGDNCIINSGVIVSHDCILENNVHLTPGSVLAGSVQVGSNSVIGMAVTIFLGVNIGSDVLIANGMDIISDIPNNSILKTINK